MAWINDAASTKGTLVFGDWLDKRGILTAYVRNRVKDDDWEINILAPDPEAPHTWMGLAFNKCDTPEGADYWVYAEREWCHAYNKYARVEEGMPINDQLGMSLLLMELEEDDGRGSEL